MSFNFVHKCAESTVFDRSSECSAPEIENTCSARWHHLLHCFRYCM